MKGSSSKPQIPYGELILKGGDSRPITAILVEMGGSVEISPGTSHDMVELELFCRLVSQVARSVGITRQLKEDHQRGQLRFDVGDDVPI